MVNPKLDCAIVLEDYAQRRRVMRGLPLVDLERMIRRGSWHDRSDGLVDILYGRWTIRVKLGRCLMSVVTLFPRR